MARRRPARPSKAFPRGALAIGAVVVALGALAVLSDPRWRTSNREPAYDARLIAFHFPKALQDRIKRQASDCFDRWGKTEQAQCFRVFLGAEAENARIAYKTALHHLHPEFEERLANACHPSRARVSDSVTRTGCYAGETARLFARSQSSARSGPKGGRYRLLEVVSENFLTSYYAMATVSVVRKKCANTLGDEACGGPPDSWERRILVSRADAPFAPNTDLPPDPPRSTNRLKGGLDGQYPRVVITDVSLLDFASGGWLKEREIWLKDGAIEWIGLKGQRRIPSEKTIVENANGALAIPGLIDAHVHVSGSDLPPWELAIPDTRATLRNMVSAGVTTAADLGGPLSELKKLRAEVNERRSVGPDLLFTGPHVAIKDGHPAAILSAVLPFPLAHFIRGSVSFEVETRRDIRAAVLAVSASGATLLKVTVDEIPIGVPKLDEKMLRHAVALAHEKGLIVAAHVGTNENMRTAIEAGVDFMAHSTYREAMSDETWRLVRERNVPIAPTIGVFNAVDDLNRGRLSLSRGADRWVSADLREAAASKPSDWKKPEIDSWLKQVAETREIRLANAARLKQRPDLLLVGSDSPSMGWPAGGGYLEELALLANAGFGTLEILRAATVNNARVLGLEDRGELRTGMRADLVLLEKDPIEDIANVAAVRAVFLEGRRAEIGAQR